MSGIVTEPDTGLIFVELSHEWGHYTPPTPGFRDIQVFRVATHAAHGVLTQRIVTAMHHGTHLNAPVHLAQGGDADTEAGRSARERNLSRIPMRRLGTPEDFIGAAVYLLSAASDWVTGQILYVDGGYTAA